MIETIDDLYAHCDLVQDNINRAFASNRDFLHLTLAMDEMELVIRRAIAGEGPDASTWGPLRANEFLQIVHDVTSWALTNFEAFKARPAAEELPHGIIGTGSPYFRKAPRLQPPYDSDASVRTLSSVNDPALRCAALWWARCVTRRVAPLLQPNEARASVAAVESAAVAVPGRPALAYRTHAALAAGVRASAVEPPGISTSTGRMRLQSENSYHERRKVSF